jgi:hypothetical protein
MKRCLVLLALTLAATAAHAQAFRCGTKLVTEGSTRSEVVAKCGEPTDVQHSSVLVPPIEWIHGRPFQTGYGLIEVPVEVWLYNLGPSKLMRQIRFEEGKVVRIETLGYGYIDNGNGDRSR